MKTEEHRLSRPNVVFVLTDDQGDADLGCTGNPWVRTPCIDALARDSVRLADYHVQPLCTYVATNAPHCPWLVEDRY